MSTKKWYKCKLCRIPTFSEEPILHLKDKHKKQFREAMAKVHVEGLSLNEVLLDYFVELPFSEVVRRLNA